MTLLVQVLQYQLHPSEISDADAKNNDPIIDTSLTTSV